MEVCRLGEIEVSVGLGCGEGLRRGKKRCAAIELIVRSNPLIGVEVGWIWLICVVVDYGAVISNLDTFKPFGNSNVAQAITYERQMEWVVITK